MTNPILKDIKDRGGELLKELTDPVNPILKAHLEGVEMFKGITAQGYTTPRNSHKVLDPDLLMDIEEVVKSFLTTYAEKILNAAKEAGPGKIKMIHAIRAQSNAGAGHTIGHNSAVSSYRAAIDEGIKEISN